MDRHSNQDILDDVLGLSRASENAVLESGRFGYYLRGMGVHPVRRIPKILDLVLEPVAISHMINLEGYTERTRVW